MMMEMKEKARRISEIRHRLRAIGDQICRYAEFVCRREEKAFFPVSTTTKIRVKDNRMKIEITVTLDEEVYREMLNADFLKDFISKKEGKTDERYFRDFEQTMKSL
jgi:hypothetical protein